MIKVKEEADFIFKYQRYRTVLDFASRAALPPPLSILSYIFDGIVACCVKTATIDRSHEQRLTGSRTAKWLEKRATEKRSHESYSYWMGLTKEYYRRKENEEREKKVAQDQVARCSPSCC